ncbi:MAG: DciA family protein [Propionibacteriaceae bacterium]|jgi:predicted nucleic acid-binding Zn ribbon protein|nr:DciA family protein [Propionibacteriaceae bacterium]
MSEIHDPTGLDVALDIADELGTILPPPRVGKPKPPRPRSARKASDLEPVGVLFAQVIGDKGWSKQLAIQQLFAAWPTLVGQTNAAHSKPVGYNAGVVSVVAESTTWATALRTIAAQVVARLNEVLGEGTVTRLEVRGPTPPSWKAGRRSVPGRGPRDTYG